MRTHVSEFNRVVSRSALGAAVLLALGNVCYAFPSSGADCAQCHTTPGGNVEVTPLSVLLGESGEVTFDVTELPSTSAALSVTGLDNPDLAAMVLNGWTDRGEGRFTMPVTATGPHVLELGTSASTVPAHYELDVFLAGSGAWSTSTSFLVSAIPEPASIALLSIIGGAFGMRWLTQRHRKKAELSSR